MSRDVVVTSLGARTSTMAQRKIDVVLASVKRLIRVGASANLVVAGFAERAGQPIRFLPFMLMAFPLMLASIVVANIYLYLRYL